ncbi:MAG: uroporphyrinogen decarboxylase family protein [Planctomycetota bacterium]
MAATPREIVRQCLAFEHPERLPRELWALPWAEEHLGEALRELRERYPADVGFPPLVYAPSSRQSGEQHAVGTYVDEWGCVFTNLQRGVIGEVRDPILKDLDAWQDVVRPPVETLPADPDAARDAVNRACAESDLYMRGGCCPRPWERYQFLRGTEEAMVDVMMPEEGMADVLAAIHAFYLRELEFWVTTDVDSVCFMDDWGSQTQLLIPPTSWRELFKPLYRDYCELAHAHGKAIFMHSDGHISEVYEDLVEVGVDALNSQLFCMDMDELARKAKGKLTFWGEIDRQHVLPAADPQVGRDAVRKVAQHLYDPAGGIIAQFELSPGSNPDVALAIFDEWDRVHAEARSAS